MGAMGPVCCDHWHRRPCGIEACPAHPTHSNGLQFGCHAENLNRISDGNVAVSQVNACLATYSPRHSLTRNWPVIACVIAPWRAKSARPPAWGECGLQGWRRLHAELPLSSKSRSGSPQPLERDSRAGGRRVNSLPAFARWLWLLSLQPRPLAACRWFCALHPPSVPSPCWRKRLGTG
jgi:hypothetical protein